MKIRKINILLAVSLGAIIVFSSCKKDDGALPKRVTSTGVPTITTNVDATASTIINVFSPATSATFSGKFKVDNYFPGATPPTKVDIMVRKNNFHPLTNPNASATNSNVKLYKAGVTVLPTTFTITAADIATLFGAPISTYDNYDFAPDFYVGDRKFEAFPVTGVGTGTGHFAQPLYSEFARYPSLCQDVNFHQGNFEVVSDAFPNGFVAGSIVVLTKASNTQFKFKAPFVTSAVDIVVNIVATTNRISTTKQKIGNAFTWDLTQTNPNVTVSAAVNNFLDPCGKTIDLNITYSTDQKLFPGTYLLRLRKL